MVTLGGEGGEGGEGGGGEHFGSYLGYGCDDNEGFLIFITMVDVAL